MSMEELTKLFTIERCSKSGAKFDFEKGKWFNHQYIQSTSNEELAKLFVPILQKQGIDTNIEYVETVVGLIKERANLIPDLWEQSSFFFKAPVSYDEKVVKKRWKEDSPAHIRELCDVLSGISDFSAHNQEEIVKKWIEDKGYHLGNIMNAFRLAIVGESKGPHMFDITATIGKEETIARLKTAVSKIV